MKANISQGDAAHFDNVELAASILAGAFLAFLGFFLLTIYFSADPKKAAEESATRQFNAEQALKNPKPASNHTSSAP